MRVARVRMGGATLKEDVRQLPCAQVRCRGQDGPAWASRVAVRAARAMPIEPGTGEPPRRRQPPLSPGSPRQNAKERAKIYISHGVVMRDDEKIPGV